MLLHCAYKANLTVINVSWYSTVVFAWFMCVSHTCTLVCRWKTTHVVSAAHAQASNLNVWGEKKEERKSSGSLLHFMRFSLSMKEEVSHQ